MPSVKDKMLRIIWNVCYIESNIIKNNILKIELLHRTFTYRSQKYVYVQREF